MAGTKRRSIRQMASRKRSIYVDPETEDEFEADTEEDYEPEEPTAPPPKKRKTVSRKPKPQTRSRVKSKPATRSMKSIFKIGKARKPNSKTVPEKKKEFAGPSDNKIPDWTSLPVDILRDIFIFASQPIHEQTIEATANVSWLFKTARGLKNRAMVGPALEAYYRSPSLLSNLQPWHFLDLLRMPKDKRYMDYNVKTHSLSIDVRRLAYCAHNRPSFDLGPLVAELPRLEHMEILHPQHEPPFRPMKIARWTFAPLDLFKIMEDKNIRLKSWRWSRDMIPKNAFLDLYNMMTVAHQGKTFNRLEKLVVCGFNYEDSSEPSEPENSGDGADAPLPPGLATSINQLPALKDLTFITCDVVMNKFLQRLPMNLERLELSNCLEITSDMLRGYFSTSSAHLKELVLNNNAALNLSFLTGLKESCPRLEVLKMDFHYYSEKIIVNDAEALYDELLSEDEIPTWPSTLRHLELEHAQKWTPEAAQNLFRSLIEAAPDLPDLRYLILHAHINIPWRDRVGFRDQWIERLRRVYLRETKEASKELGSLRQFRLWKQSQKQKISGRDEPGNDDSDVEIPASFRKVSHVQISPHKPSGDTDAYSDSDIPTTTGRQPRRSKRVADSQVSQAEKSTSPEAESESEDESSAEDWRKQPEKFTQGLCEVVDIRIDNQRPRENQWTEGDFLDSEISGDEDWMEGASDEEQEVYAW
ncbi:uncharacterized protein CLAFUR5_03388 [Fulvia fulva]|uniref:Uncharacterized protein n=1 Tax=Passalora fulva TaxID=5499 RepID=A0A9Q8P5P4_PASFU|nr:uncharacterized protein CLAFUR5_03388 [Fulvia fulva]KAK4633607.1 hypothetical protein CLAFUR0_03401 [Fulvia fulva]UJO13967.1 hypothetical protein CLAFUR5_03388 [Fulvia fulva]